MTTMTTMTTTPSTTPRTPAATPDVFAAAFEALDADSPVHGLRERGYEHFQALGFPTLRNEEWRYTNVRSIARTAFIPAHAEPTDAAIALVKRHMLRDTPAHKVVFINGRHRPELSEIGEDDLRSGVRLESLATAVREDCSTLRSWLGQHADMQRDAFAALNTALLADGAFLYVPRDVSMTRPVHLLFIATAPDEPAMTHPRILIVAEAGSRATIVETYVSEGAAASLTNTVTEIVARDGANVDHYKVVREGPAAFHVSSLNIHQAKDTNVASHCFSIGGRLVRNNLNAALDGTGCHSTFNGLVVARGEQHVDNHLSIEHLKPNCNSWEYYKTILDEKARGVFTGRIYVAQDAQKTDAKQTSMNLLLSDGAEVTAKPQLEIFANDVKCTHGATIGQIDDDQLFYLRSRGIDPVVARSLLVYAFANETIREVRIDELRARLEDVVLGRLPQGRELQGGL